MRRAAGRLIGVLLLLFPAPALAQESRRIEIPRGDGTTIDINVWDRGDGADGALLLIGGSDCLLNQHRAFFPRLLAGASKRWVVSVEKEGASETGRCAEGYERTSPESQRALDHVRAMTWMKRELDLPSTRAFQVVGTSAGGFAACAVAGATDDVGALALMSVAGGQSFEADMRDLTQNSGRIAAEIDRVLVTPRLGQTWLGEDNPEIWWWSALPLACADQLEGWSGPTLVLHGAADEAVPVASARLLAEKLRVREASVDYVELAGAGHDLFINAAERPVEGDGLDIALKWLAQQQRP